MNILVIEDDSFKFSKIEEVINTTLTNAFITKVDNVHDAVVYLNSDTPDKIVLDMSLPSHAAKSGEGSPLSMPTGGIEIILELRSINKKDVDIIVLTQYPDIEIENEYYSIDESAEKIKEMYGMSNLSVLHYDNDSNVWCSTMINFLRA